MLEKFISLYHNKWKCLFCLPVIIFTVASPAAGGTPDHTKRAGIVFTTANMCNTTDTLPRFPEGEKAYSRFLSKNIRYPRAEHERNITGIVKARYTILPDGSVTDISIVEEPEQASGLGQEVKRVLGLMPRFETAPGTTEKTTKILTAKFKLEDEYGQMKGPGREIQADVVVVGYSIVRKSTVTY